jgi:alpha-mannosidase
MLDDFNLYENREKSIKANRSFKPDSQTDVFNDEIAVSPSLSLVLWLSGSLYLIAIRFSK